MGRSYDDPRGFREANSLAVRHLHALADRMNAPAARIRCNSPADQLGALFRNLRQDRAARQDAFVRKTQREQGQ